jgi:hypothetical protein
MLNPARLRAPSDDGDVLIEPPGPAALGLLDHNSQTQRGWRFGLCGVPAAEVRAQARRALDLDPDRPIVAVGHQPEFYHAGVWAKGVVCAYLAECAAGQAVHVLVDHDHIRARSLAVPRAVGGSVRVESVILPGFDRAQAYEQLPPWSPDEVDELERELRRAAVLEQPASLLPELLMALRGAAQERSWPAQWARGLGAMDERFDIRLRAVLASELNLGCFHAELIGQARRFAGSYNAALADYRAEQNIRTPGQPVPDLILEDERVELPMWGLYSGRKGRRERLFVVQRGERMTLRAGAEDLLTCWTKDFSSWESAGPLLASLTRWALRPRALALTLWIRLMLCDLFIHGIGGARYDQITERIMREYFGLQPPEMVVVTATLRLALPVHGVSPGDVAAARRRLRDHIHNPVPAAGAPSGADLLLEKQHCIAESTRLRQQRSSDHAARRQVFNRIRALNGTLAGLRGGEQDEAHRRLQDLLAQDRSDQAARSREYFYGLLPMDRLRALRARLLAAMPPAARAGGGPRPA